jgi:hypothetical protein
MGPTTDEARHRPAPAALQRSQQGAAAAPPPDLPATGLLPQPDRDRADRGTALQIPTGDVPPVTAPLNFYISVSHFISFISFIL